MFLHMAIRSFHFTIDYNFLNILGELGLDNYLGNILSKKSNIRDECE